MALKYILAAQTIKDMILQNLQSGNELLPTEMQLSEQLKVSRQTIRQALSVLKSEGLIEKRQGSGTYISKQYMASSSYRTIVVLYHFSDVNYYSFSRSLTEYFKTLGYQCIFHDIADKFSTERQILQNLLLSPPAAVLAAPVKSLQPSVNADLYHALAACGTHLFFCRKPSAQLQQYPYLDMDDRQGGYLLGSRLINQGHRHICGIFRNDCHSGTQRFLGVVSALLEHNLSFDDDAFLWYDSSGLKQIRTSSPLPQFTDFIEQQLPKCSVVICQEEHIAVSIIREAAARGIRIPQQLLVCTFLEKENSVYHMRIPCAYTSVNLWEESAKHLSLHLKGKAPALKLLRWELR